MKSLSALCRISKLTLLKSVTYNSGSQHSSTLLVSAFCENTPLLNSVASQNGIFRARCHCIGLAFQTSFVTFGSIHYAGAPHKRLTQISHLGTSVVSQRYFAKLLVSIVFLLESLSPRFWLMWSCAKGYFPSTLSVRTIEP